MGGLAEDGVIGGKLEADGPTVNVKENVEMRWKSAIILINMFLILVLRWPNTVFKKPRLT